MKKLPNKSSSESLDNQSPEASSSGFVSRIILCINTIIDHRFFKPVSFIVIASFMLFHVWMIAQNVIANKKEQQLKSAPEPVKISISGEKFRFDFDEDQVVTHRIKSGDTLQKILNDIGVSDADVKAIFASLKKVFNLNSITTGDTVTITYKVKIEGRANQEDDASDSEADVKRRIVVSDITIMPSPDEEIITLRKGDDYETKKIKVALARSISRYHGVIRNGLYADGVSAGISPRTMMNMINLYGYDIDFQRDIHDGDKFEMLVESYYSEDGKKVKDGDVLYASLVLNNKTIETYLHKVEGRVEYFDGNGNSIKKSLLRTPINGARISSGFGMRRHPVLGYSKMHKGTDFAAPTGTPILAAGNGTIVYYGVHGGYGNYVRIKHTDDYSTAYGHASRFNPKFRVGSKVKQGDVVAFVGTTGRSTGPHLHFEVLLKGSQINPAKVKATSGIRLAGKELIKFKGDKNEIDNYRRNIPNLIK